MWTMSFGTCRTSRAPSNSLSPSSPPRPCSRCCSRYHSLWQGCRHGPARWIATGYIELFRNTPLLIQLYFIFFGLPIAGIVFSPFVSGMLALGAQHAAFFAEILRGMIQSVPGGQRDAGLALGMMPAAVMRKIVLPQAIRNSVPAMGGQFALLLHDTSLASTIGLMEITLQGRTLAEQSAASFEMFVAVGAIYLLLSAAFSILIRGVEQTVRYAR